MATVIRLLSRHVLALQLTVAAAAIGAIGLTPPATGKMLLIPVESAAGSRLTRTAIDTGALIIGRGPIAGSLIVYGDSRRLAAPLLRRGAIAIAAPDTSCGSGAA